MKPAATYEDVCNYIARMYYCKSGQEIPAGPNPKVRMVGLLFARPQDTFADVEVVPNLDYFHYRSGKHIDFFCAGYDGYTGRDETEGYRKINKEPELQWGFSERMFIRFVDDIETRSSWKYSGNPELLLANTVYDATERAVHLDLNHRVQCKLKEMKDCGAISSVTSFMEDIIRYAEHADGEDPTWGFSDAQGMKLTGSALRRFVLALLPKNLGREAERAAHFAVVG